MRYLDVGTAKQISKIGLGTWQFGSREWGYGDRYADQVARAIVRRALELGVTLFDTAEIHGFGRSEKILGQALRWWNSAPWPARTGWAPAISTCTRCTRLIR
jgi:aryl-alcohol dehydrogenase-like predicted oxidoreductase